VVRLICSSSPTFEPGPQDSVFHGSGLRARAYARLSSTQLKRTRLRMNNLSNGLLKTTPRPAPPHSQPSFEQVPKGKDEAISLSYSWYFYI